MTELDDPKCMEEYHQFDSLTDENDKFIFDFFLVPSYAPELSNSFFFLISEYLPACVKDTEWMKERANEDFKFLCFADNNLPCEDLPYIKDFVKAFCENSSKEYIVDLSYNEFHLSFDPSKTPMVEGKVDNFMTLKILKEIATLEQVSFINVRGNPLASINSHPYLGKAENRDLLRKLVWVKEYHLEKFFSLLEEGWSKFFDKESKDIIKETHANYEKNKLK